MHTQSTRRDKPRTTSPLREPHTSYLTRMRAVRQSVSPTLDLQKSSIPRISLRTSPYCKTGFSPVPFVTTVNSRLKLKTHFSYLSQVHLHQPTLPCLYWNSLFLGYVKRVLNFRRYKKAYVKHYNIETYGGRRYSSMHYRLH